MNEDRNKHRSWDRSSYLIHELSDGGIIDVRVYDINWWGYGERSLGRVGQRVDSVHQRGHQGVKHHIKELLTSTAFESKIGAKRLVSLEKDKEKGGRRQGIKRPLKRV